MSIKPSIYDQVELIGKDGKTADIRLACASIDLYEDLLCPAISASIQIANSGTAIRDESGTPVSLYEGMKVNGGEVLKLRIKSNSATNKDIELVSTPLYVRGIKNLMREAQSEFFIMHLSSREAFQNETVFLKKKYSKEATTSDHVRSIISESFVPTPKTDIDPTSSKVGFLGNNMKPFEALVMLASKSVPPESIDGSAGYFFYQTLEDMRFKSIDTLASEDIKAEYVHTEVNYNSIDYKPTPDLPSLDCKIINYNVDQNQDLVKNLKKGTYSSDRRFFNPITFSVDPPTRFFSGNDYINKAKNLGNPFDPKNFQLADSTLSFTEVPSRILTSTYDFNTVDSKVNKDLTQDIRQFESQKRMRYNTLFSQSISLQVPLNSNLHAGDLIQIKIPRISDKKTEEFDRGQISGIYMIKELNHHFDSRGSYTTMKVVRDSYGDQRLS